MKAARMREKVSFRREKARLAATTPVAAAQVTAPGKIFIFKQQTAFGRQEARLLAQKERA